MTPATITLTAIAAIALYATVVRVRRTHDAQTGRIDDLEDRVTYVEQDFRRMDDMRAAAVLIVPVVARLRGRDLRTGRFLPAKGMENGHG